MVGALQYLKKGSPKTKGRGSGYYYHRGKGHYSKYSEHLDSMRVATPVDVRTKSGKKKFSKHWHMYDKGTKNNL